jgi:hypothetical protein
MVKSFLFDSEIIGCIDITIIITLVSDKILSLFLGDLTFFGEMASLTRRVLGHMHD